MFQSHLFLMGVYAILVGLVGGVLTKDTPRAQARSGAAMAGGLLGAALVAGWVLYGLPW